MADATPAQDPTRPTTPDGTYLAAVRTAIERAAATAEPLRSAHTGAAEDVLAATEAAVEDLGPNSWR